LAAPVSSGVFSFHNCSTLATTSLWSRMTQFDYPAEDEAARR
jgi:hypothetical protein